MQTQTLPKLSCVSSLVVCCHVHFSFGCCSLVRIQNAFGNYHRMVNRVALHDFYLNVANSDSYVKWEKVIISAAIGLTLIYKHIHTNRMNRHLIVAVGFEYLNDPRSYVARGLLPLVGSPKANRS